MRTTLTGIGTLTRLAVRRDRFLLGAGTLLLVGICAASAIATSSLYSTAAQQVAAAQAIDASPALVALYGPILDTGSVGELAMTKMTVLYAVFVAVLLGVLVRRHTRSEEESGRAELLAGTAIGRATPLAAATAEGAGASLLVGAGAAVVDVAAGLPVTGSLLFGASWTGIGIVAAGLTATACQLSASTRTCAAITAGALGALFALRAVGDTTELWLSWLSPFGWSTQLRAWSGPRWWVLLLYPATAAALLATAHLLRARRDLDGGLLAPRPGPAIGSPWLGDATALTIRLHATTVFVWTAAIAVLGLALGAIAPNIGDLLGSPSGRDMLARIGGVGAVQDALLAAELSIVAVLVSCFAVTVITHGGAEEHDGRTEQVLATATSRRRVYLAIVAVAIGGTTWLLLIAGLSMAVGFGAVAGNLSDGIHRTLPAALAQAPAVWLVTALAMTAYALRSTLAAAGWVLLALFLTLGQVGELLRLPSWAIDISPFAHVPRMPVEGFALAPTVTMSFLAVALLAAGAASYRTRDIG
ncbi:ABC transporter permease [Dermatophilaceae bacterium Sec6.4]